MPIAPNVAVLETAREHWNASNLEGYLELYHEDAVLQGYAGVEPGLASIRRFYEAFWIAFPGSHLAFEDAFASGEKVACRFVVTGVHGGTFQGIPATGRAITLPGITIVEFNEARCVRRWSYTDSAGLLQRLGAFPVR